MVEDDPTDRLLAELAETILRIARDLDPHAAGLDVVPLTGTETAVLRWVHRNPGTSPSAAADATGLRRPNLSAAVRSLEEKGLVRRSPDPADQRQQRLEATSLADEGVGRLHAYWSGRVRAALGDDLAEAGAVVDLLDRLESGLRAH
ncbi:MarR family transcriptional regulator [Demequina sp. SYSU T00192]|uniref:MarR family transcriptional regulator n=1 Tax=Demequina litoralis TaxID=3051660 RepID=A0ABT8GBR2_9MICO|nr:MarR family transcriptional regulator [Demequina sp. SYSU T00192]MDN4476104.1 MarR family transcriptional regulator [Demequina sp. SYSU T00192]